jgi:hypothetical protein
MTRGTKVLSFTYLALKDPEKWMSMEHWWSDTDKGSRSPRSKTCLKATFAPQIPHVLAWDQTQTTKKRENRSENARKRGRNWQKKFWVWRCKTMSTRPSCKGRLCPTLLVTLSKSIETIGAVELNKLLSGFN